MPKQAAGILVYRRKGSRVEVMLAHSGGPFFANKDATAWSIPKGEFDADEQPLDAAKREFKEETGQSVPAGEMIYLGTIKQKNHKIVHGWAVEGEFDTTKLVSNTFELEWPPKSGNKQQFPEIDKFEWYTLEQAVNKLRVGQDTFLVKLAQHLGVPFEKVEQASLF